MESNTQPQIQTQIDLEGIQQFIAKQAIDLAMLMGQFTALQKHSAKQAEELAKLRAPKEPEAAIVG